jgi:hypothetical protein
VLITGDGYKVLLNVNIFADLGFTVTVICRTINRFNLLCLSRRFSDKYFFFGN